MKNLLIATRHAVPNYGSILQTIATVRTFENLGFNVEILNYIPDLEKPENLHIPMLANSRFRDAKIRGAIYRMVRKPDFWRMGLAFKQFQKATLPLTGEINSIEEYYLRIGEYDAYITGGDQVWGPIATSEYDRLYFWDFLTKKNIFSYSSSFGKADIQASKQDTIRGMLEKYKYLTVREDTAVKIIKKMGFDNVDQVLDPVFMPDTQYWKEFSKKPQTTRPYMLVYQVHASKSFEEYTRDIAKKKGLELIRVSNSFAHSIRSGKFAYLPTPEEFLGYFEACKYVITDSFHATVFSIIFEKQFSVFHSGITNTRIESLLRKFDLKSRLIQDNSDFSQLKKEVDYSRVSKELKQQRDSSLGVISHSITDKIC